MSPEAASVESEQFEYYHNDDNDADDVKDVVTHNQYSSRDLKRAMGKTHYVAHATIAFNPALAFRKFATLGLLVE